MAGSSSTMAMRRDIAGEYSPSGVHPSACHRFARIARRVAIAAPRAAPVLGPQCLPEHRTGGDRKSTRLNSSHSQISYAVFCLKKKKREVTALQCIIREIYLGAIRTWAACAT